MTLGRLPHNIYSLRIANKPSEASSRAYKGVYILYRSPTIPRPFTNRVRPYRRKLRLSSRNTYETSQLTGQQQNLTKIWPLPQNMLRNPGPTEQVQYLWHYKSIYLSCLRMVFYMCCINSIIYRCRDQSLTSITKKINIPMQKKMPWWHNFFFGYCGSNCLTVTRGPKLAAN